MAAASCLLLEDQFLCSICLDVFTDPVTIPWGHNLCKSCIAEHWRVNVPYQCPLCKEVFKQRPQLKVNTLLSEMVAQFKMKTQYKPKNNNIELKRTWAEIQQMIQERRLKIQEIQHSVDLSKKAADRETAEGVEVFTALMESVQRSLNQLKEEIQQKHRTTEKRAEDFIKELEQEISELKKRSSKVEQLTGSEDHLHIVQRFTSVKAAPPMKTWTKVNIRPPSYAGTVVRAVSQLEDKVREDMKKVLEAELRRVQQYEVDVTLDPDTAYPYLILSSDKKQAHDGDVRMKLPDNPERFAICRNVLGKQLFLSGRFYFEVQVKGKTKWDVGVARESITRKGVIPPCPQNGHWIIGLRNRNKYCAFVDPPVPLALKSGLQKVGVFVDYEEGLVSFYDVDSSVLIYSFTGCYFTDQLLPFFSPCGNDGGKNSAPLIITPVRL